MKAVVNRGVAAALGAAALFGAGTPFAKMLLAHTSPWLLAGNRMFYPARRSSVSGTGRKVTNNMNESTHDSGHLRKVEPIMRWIELCLVVEDLQVLVPQAQRIAKPPNGWIESVLGLHQFRLRGLHRAHAEFKLVCLALKPRRMDAMQAK